MKDVNSLVFNSKGTWNSQAGYDPGSDWGASLIDAIPDWGLLKGFARWAGGEDYQKFEDSYGAFEAAMLPIISGAAITPSEGQRLIKPLRIKIGDTEDTKKRKIAAMSQMAKGAEMAARGDIEGFLGTLDEIGETTGTGPVKRAADAPAPAAPTGKTAPEFEGYTYDGQPITEDDIQVTMRNNNMTREQVIAALRGPGQ